MNRKLTTNSQHGFKAIARISPYFEGVEQAGGCRYDKQLNTYVPWSYPIDRADLYAAVTQAATLWDTASEQQIEVSGPDALALANLAATRDLSRLKTGRCCYTFFCDPMGRVICDPIVMRVTEDRFWFSVAGTDLGLWLRGLAIGGRYNVKVKDLEIAPLQLQGPRSYQILKQICNASLEDLKFFQCIETKVADIDTVVSRTGWSGEFGYELYPYNTPPYPYGAERAMRLWNALMEAGQDLGLIATSYTLDRALECGFMVFNNGNGEDMNALEFWRDNMVDLNGKNFIGKQALLDIANDGGPTRLMMGMIAICEDTVIIPGEWDIPVQSGDEVIGKTRRIGYSFQLKRTIAAGLLDRDKFSLGDEVDIVHPGGKARVRIQSLPFVASTAGTVPG